MKTTNKAEKTYGETFAKKLLALNDSDMFSAVYAGEIGECLAAFLYLGGDKETWHRCTTWPPLLIATVRGVKQAGKSKYDTQAEQFLASNGIKFRATLSDTKTPAWEGYTPKKPCPDCIKSSGIAKREYPLGHPQTVYERHRGINNPVHTPCATCNWTGEVPDLDARKHGHHYRVTLSGLDPEGYTTFTLYPVKRKLVFDFWGSIADAEKGIRTVKPYDVLACISGDVNTPDTFADFCAEYGYGQDSIKALQTFRRCSSFAKRLRAFFTEAELEQLQRGFAKQIETP